MHRNRRCELWFRCIALYRLRRSFPVGESYLLVSLTPQSELPMNCTRRWSLLSVVALSLAICPALSSAQATATICKDGSTSIASGRGACSGHGGVNKKATSKEKSVVKQQVKAAKVAASATPGATVAVTCTDGSTSTATGRGACSGHGGVRAATTNFKKTGAIIPAPGTAVPPASERKTGKASAASVGSGAKEDNNPAGAIAKCKDGLYSHAKHHQGACSRHGGVASWL